MPTALRTAPGQVVAAPEGTVKVIPAGRVSLTAMPFRVWVAFGLVIVKVSAEIPLTEAVLGANALPIAGALSTTVVAVGGTLSLVDSVVSMIALPILAVAELLKVPGVAGRVTWKIRVLVVPAGILNSDDQVRVEPDMIGFAMLTPLYVDEPVTYVAPAGRLSMKLSRLTSYAPELEALSV